MLIAIAGRLVCFLARIGAWLTGFNLAVLFILVELRGSSFGRLIEPCIQFATATALAYFTPHILVYVLRPIARSYQKVQRESSSRARSHQSSKRPERNQHQSKKQQSGSAFRPPRPPSASLSQHSYGMLPKEYPLIRTILENRDHPLRAFPQSVSKKEFRKLAFEVHPDRVPLDVKPYAEDAFKLLNSWRSLIQQNR